MTTIIQPHLEGGAFTCPHCKSYSQQEWNPILGKFKGDIKLATCQYCKKPSLRYSVETGYHGASINWKMIFPKTTVVELPNEDLDQTIKDDYIEASKILSDSPRGAAALLRLSVQKLMKQVGLSGSDINTDIGTLVKNGLNATIQQALDSVRVIGNEAVHPGTFDLKDDTEIAIKLFSLINIIADYLITQPRKIEEIYGSLPPGKLQGIQDRDNSNKND